MTDPELDNSNTEPSMQVWRLHPIFRGLDDAQAEVLAPFMRLLTLEQGAFLMREGDPATELYFLQSGAVEVLRAERGTQRQHVIARIERGDVIGEMALITGRSRAATIRASEPSRLLALPFEALRPPDGNLDAGPLRDAYAKIVTNVAGTLSDRIRSSNDEALEAAQARVAMGQFTINIFMLLALYVLLLGSLPLLKGILPDDSAYITVPLLVVFGAIVYHFMSVSGYPMATYGITTRDLGRVTGEGVLYTLPLLALMTVLKWGILRWSPSRAGGRLFDYEAVFHKLGASQFLLILAVYLIFTSVQELIVRGGLQSALQLFLASPRRHLTAIVVSNILFSVVHMHLSPAFALMAFFPGLYWGWVYRRQHHLAGVTVSHMLVGAYLFFVLGPL